MDLFDHQRQEEIKKASPLAERMRPRDLDEFVGQEEVLGQGRVLRRAIESDRVPSMMFWGPPGSGKTTLARIIARRTRSHFEQISAVTSGVADLRRLIAEAKDRLGMYRQKTIVFIDEIHRFNKAQQDALLPHVEDGTVILIGATTENPYFSVNPALISRTRVFRLKPYSDDEIRSVVARALRESDRGLGEGYVLDPDALDHIIMVANGDSRSALNALELAADLASGAGRDKHITLDDAVEAVQQRAVTYDRDGDQHYDTISAFIKSMRGSDPDAAVYWLARMVYAGEDPRFIARRIVICAAEDVGNADPTALILAQAASEAVERLGLPEARIPLAQASIYVACAPKSNAVCNAIDEAMRDIAEGPPAVVPLHLRDASYKAATQMGHGREYKYPHSFPDHYVAQQYLPDSLVGKSYYEPTEQGHESTLADRLRRLKETPGKKV